MLRRQVLMPSFAAWLLAALAVPGLGSRLRLAAQGKAKRLGVDYKLRLSNFDNVQYTAPISLGGQSVPAIYDTGSFEILVLSTACSSCASQLEKYDSGSSRTFSRGAGTTARHNFGSGPAVSVQGVEDVKIGPASSPVAVSGMPFWQVVEHSIEVWDGNAHFSGIVGLSHTDTIPAGYGAGPAHERTLLTKLGISAFAICLERGWVGAPGWLSMGPSVDNAEYTGSFSVLKVVGQVHWGVRMHGFSVEGHHVVNPCTPSCGAIIDSGTSLIAVPSSAASSVKALISRIKSDCSNINSLPSIHFNLDGVDVQLPPQAYVLKFKTPVRKRTSYYNPTTTMKTQCSHGFMTINKHSAHGPVWILGMSFLRYHHVVFDRSKKQLLLAKTSPSCTTYSTGMGFANMTGMALANASGLAGGLRDGSGASVFASSDFEPLGVDPDALRAPGWALGDGQLDF